MKHKFISLIFSLFIFATTSHVLANEDTYIVTLKDDVALFGLSQNTERNYTVVSSDELEKYLKAGMVLEYEPNYEATLFGTTWNVDAVNCGFAWELGCFGNEIRVGVIDSGIYPFQELSGNITAGRNYLTGTTDTTDNIGHGTFVSGIIASKSNGIAYKSRIIPLKCFDNNVTTYVDVLIDAVYDAVDVYGCDVINMSFGLPGNSVYFERAINYATNKGVIVVAAVGNDGTDKLYYPAAYNNVVGVASVDKNLKQSWFSQYNSSVFVTAPGQNVKSLMIPGFSKDSGTSFSTPHITALAAVAKSIDRSINVNQFKNILSKSCDDLGDEGYDVCYGYGMVNFEKFIREMLQDTEMFVSPVNGDNGKIYTVMYNPSENEKTLSVVYALYNADVLDTFSVVPVTLSPDETYRFENPIARGTVKYMFWDDLQNLKPLRSIKKAYVY